MYASKENAREAQRLLELCSTTGKLLVQHETFLTEFLKAAEKRLPTEASLAKDRDRRKVKK